MGGKVTADYIRIVMRIVLEDEVTYTMASHLWQTTQDLPPRPTNSPSSRLAALTKLHYGQGEKRLMLAILIDAIGSIEHYQSGHGAHSWGDCRDALGWVLAHDRRWLFSFENICTTLEIDPAKLRTALQAEFPSLFFYSDPRKYISPEGFGKPPAGSRVTAAATTLPNSIDGGSANTTPVPI